MRRRRRIRRWAEAHPRVWAARHVAKAVVEVVVGLVLARIALGLVLDLDWGWLPDWRPPDLPSIPWPDIAWPSIGLPDWSVPGWLAAVLATKKYWFPILVAIALAVAEVKRRKRREAEQDDRQEDRQEDRQDDRREDRENAAWPGPSTPRSTPHVVSRSSRPGSPASPPTATPVRPPR